MIRRTRALASMFVATVALATVPDGVVSPSGTLVLRVRQVGAESEVSVLTTKGQRLASHSFVSADGDHGYAVGQATWSPDSRYLVVTAGNVGGHQPWRTVTAVYAADTRRFFFLDEHCGGVVAPASELAFHGAGTLVVTVGTPESSFERTETRELQLDQLAATCGKRP